jgi:hypothetical protein
LLDPKTGALLREHLTADPGRHRMQPADRPSRTPPGVTALLVRAHGIGAAAGVIADAIYADNPIVGVRRVHGLCSLAKKHGVVAVERAAQVALDAGAHTYRAVKVCLDRDLTTPIGLRQIGPVIRKLTEYRDVDPSHHRGRLAVNLVEIDRALRKLRLSGMADVLEIRVQGAAAERLPHLDFLSSLVGDELLRRQDRLLGRRIKAGWLPRKRQDARQLRSRLQQEDESAAHLRARDRALRGASRGRAVSRTARTGKSHLAQALGLSAIQQGHRVLYREVHALLDELADATLERRRKEVMTDLATAPRSSSTTSACASCRRPRPRISSS